MRINHRSNQPAFLVTCFQNSTSELNQISDNEAQRVEILWIDGTGLWDL